MGAPTLPSCKPLMVASVATGAGKSAIMLHVPCVQGAGGLCGYLIALLSCFYSSSARRKHGERARDDLPAPCQCCATRMYGSNSFKNKITPSTTNMLAITAGARHHAGCRMQCYLPRIWLQKRERFWRATANV